MHRYLSIPMAGLIGILLVSGCSPSSASTNISVASNLPSQTESNMTSAASSQSWESTGKNTLLLQGRILEIGDTAPYSLKIHLDNVLYSGLVTPRLKFPEPIGSTVTVHFKEPFATQGLMQPVVGKEVIVGVKQYTAGTDAIPFWGSDTSRYYYKKNGRFYGENGLQLGIAT